MAAGPPAVRVSESTFRCPPGAPPAGPLPRNVLRIELTEQGENLFDDPCAKSFWVFDPAEPQKGARLLRRVAGDSASLSFDTPLFGGWGIASGRLNADDQGSGRFWFNLLTGEEGENLGDDPFDGRIDANGWTYLNPLPDDTGSTRYRIVRRDLPDGKRRELDLPLSHVQWMDDPWLLGIHHSPRGPELVRLDWKNATRTTLGPLPDALIPEQLPDLHVHPAGPNGAEGCYAVTGFFTGFSLYYLPAGENRKKDDWKRVAHDVHVVKTFGGAAPWLPVEYVGDGRFAIAKTVKDSVPVPDSWPGDDRHFGAAEAVTMWVNAQGEVLETTKPYAYNHNPPVRVPGGWRSQAIQQSVRPPRTEPPPMIRIDGNIAIFANGTREPISPKEQRELSDDHRSLVVFRDDEKTTTGGTRVTFRAYDGATGAAHRFEIPSDFHRAMVNCYWETLCSRNPEPGVLERYGRARRNE